MTVLLLSLACCVGGLGYLVKKQRREIDILRQKAGEQAPTVAPQAVAVAFPAAVRPATVNIEAQKAAMRKLDSMAGKWSGHATVQRGPGAPLQLIQTEELHYRLDGLLLAVEGKGRAKDDGPVVFNAFAVISYDEAAAVYRMRAYNDGCCIDAELKLNEKGNGYTWGMDFSQIQIGYEMQIDEQGIWTEIGWVTLNGQTPRKFVELKVRRNQQVNH